MMNWDNFIITIIVLILGLYASVLLYNSYFSIRIRQKKLERTFNKQLLKNAGFSSIGKRLFEFCFDILLFWLLFYYKKGIAIFWIKNALQKVCEMIMFLLPTGRDALMKIDFALYSFTAVIVIAVITTVLCIICIEFKLVWTACIVGLVLFITIWYIDLGICYFFFIVLHAGTIATFLEYILAIVCYIVVLIANGLIFSYISTN